MLKTILTKTLIDSTMALVIIQSIMGDVVRETATIIMVAVTVATLNFLVEYVILPLVSKTIKHVKKYTPDNVDEELDKLEGVITDYINKRKEEIINDVKNNEVIESEGKINDN